MNATKLIKKEVPRHDPTEEVTKKENSSSSATATETAFCGKSAEDEKSTCTSNKSKKHVQKEVIVKQEINEDTSDKKATKNIQKNLKKLKETLQQQPKNLPGTKSKVSAGDQRKAQLSKDGIANRLAKLKTVPVMTFSLKQGPVVNSGKKLPGGYS